MQTFKEINTLLLVLKLYLAWVLPWFACPLMVNCLSAGGLFSCCHKVFDKYFYTLDSFWISKYINRGSYTSGHFISNLWNEPLASFINFIRNDHECKILFIIWLFKWVFIAFKVDIISIENIKLSRTASWRFAPVTKCYVTCGHTVFMTWP